MLIGIIAISVIGLSVMVILGDIFSESLGKEGTKGISASSGIPKLINYQGKLTDKDGNPLACFPHF